MKFIPTEPIKPLELLQFHEPKREDSKKLAYMTQTVANKKYRYNLQMEFNPIWNPAKYCG